MYDEINVNPQQVRYNQSSSDGEATVIIFDGEHRVLVLEPLRNVLRRLTLTAVQRMASGDVVD